MTDDDMRSKIPLLPYPPPRPVGLQLKSLPVKDRRPGTYQRCKNTHEKDRRELGDVPRTLSFRTDPKVPYDSLDKCLVVRKPKLLGLSLDGGDILRNT